MSARGCQLAKFTNISGKFPNLEKNIKQIFGKSQSYIRKILVNSKANKANIRQISGKSWTDANHKQSSDKYSFLIISSTFTVFKSTTRLKSKVFSLERLYTFLPPLQKIRLSGVNVASKKFGLKKS